MVNTVNEDEMSTMAEIDRAIRQYIKHQAKMLKQAEKKKISKEELKRMKKLETNTDEW